MPEANPATAGPVGRIVFVGQWVAVFLAPILLFGVRGALSGWDGWLSGPGLFLLAPPMLLALALPAMLVFADPAAVRRRATGREYGLASLVLWAAVLGMTLTVPDGEPPASLLSRWTGLVSAHPDSGLVFAGFALAAVASWLIAVGFAAAGVFNARREQAAERR